MTTALQDMAGWAVDTNEIPHDARHAARRLLMDQIGISAKRGLFSRVRGDVYVLAPPVVITDAEIDRTVEVLSESVTAVLG